ncbi:hypothetical protein CRUP_016772 [Coryphaenoides rupestris]|nr:hypothetical protein CRUP_016772 [Coryphaenoides rupestris]
MEDPYQNNVVQQQGGDAGQYTYTQGGSGPDGYPYQTDFPPRGEEEEDAASDATEGHDEEEQMYEGEYRGIPHPDEIKEARRAARTEARRKARLAAQQEDEDQLPDQYETIMEDCGHGRFQWTLFGVLGLALMADGVDSFVVGFVLPSAEKDMCISNADKGMLGKWGYGFFLFFRFCSGFGIGGSIPIVYTYFTEFLQVDKRGEHLSWLCMFWMLGGLYASFMAWTIIPHYGWGFAIGTEVQFHGWRAYILVCVFPAVAALVGAMFIPESPRFLLENGRHDEAWMILRKVHDTNWKAKGEPERVFTVTNIKTPQTQEDEFIEIQSETGTAFQRWTVRHTTLLQKIHREGEYLHDKFEDIEMKSVKFEDSLFENCYFEDIRSTNTFFEKCTLKDTVFYNTDLWQEKFKDCRMENTTFLHPKSGCHLNFQEENDIIIYLVSFLGSLAVLPGNILSALFLDKIGRVKIIGSSVRGSMLGSSACSFLLLLSFSQGAVICWQCVFYAVSVAAWNGLQVISVELYPSAKRGTAFGILNAVCKFAAIIGSFIFASFIGITKIIPIFLAFAALVCGGLLALKLPETREKVLL